MKWITTSKCYMGLYYIEYFIKLLKSIFTKGSVWIAFILFTVQIHYFKNKKINNQRLFNVVLSKVTITSNHYLLK